MAATLNTPGERDSSGFVTARVLSAFALPSARQAGLERLLSDKLGKRVQVSARVDPGVIGGLYIEVDGMVIDRTVKTKLADLAGLLDRGGVL